MLSRPVIIANGNGCEKLNIEMKLVTHTFDKDGTQLVAHEINISGRYLEIVKRGLKSAMRAAVFRSKLETFKMNHPDIDCGYKALPSIIATYPELTTLESWEIEAIDNYVNDLFKQHICSRNTIKVFTAALQVMSPLAVQSPHEKDRWPIYIYMFVCIGCV